MATTKPKPKSKAGSVDDYLAALPADRRAVVAEVRKLIQRNLPRGYQESVNWGMISYEIPLERYPNTYNGQPLGYLALAAQKNYYALYLMGAYADPKQAAWLDQQFEKAGKKLDMGKSCVRFKKADDLALDIIGQVIASVPVVRYIERAKAAKRR